MSRVYDTPRYEDQVLNKTLIHLDVARMQRGANDHRERFGNPRARTKTFDAVKYELQQLQLLTADEVDCMGPDDVEDADLYLQYCLSDAVSRPGVESFSRTVATGAVISTILAAHPNLPIWCDFDASIRICHGYLSGKYTGSLSEKDQKIMMFADNTARDICSIAVAACRIGRPGVALVCGSTTPQAHAPLDWKKMIIWNKGMELLRLKSMTQDCVEAHSRIRDGWFDIPVEEFSCNKTRAARTIMTKELYRVMGLYIMVYQDAVYIIDYSAMDQIHQVSKMWEGFYKYAYNYRLSGSLESRREINNQVIDACRAWLCDALEQTNFSDALPRCMKQSLALLQNDMHASAERLDVNLGIKTEKLEELIRSICKLKVYWHEFLRSTGISERAQLDIAHVFYALPAPDCNVKDLFERASVYMSKANVAEPFLFYDFMNYCMAVDLCKALVSYKRDVNIKCVDGYTCEDKSWFSSCIKGKIMLPPDEEMGKAWIYDFFPFNNTLPQWYWEAADVTHVMADNSYYNDLETFNDQPRHFHNELLYALEKAPLLSDKHDPMDVFNEVGSSNDDWDRMAVMAVKCENTKPGKKCRETWSADDITRELTTCYDRAAIPIAAMYKGVTARKSDIEVQAIFDKICLFTRKDCDKKAIIISNDVSGWSPLGDREAWARHHDYLIGMTKAPKHLRLEKIWKGIRAYVAKRGFIASAPLEKGLFQGWTGTCDSIFNVHISLYCVRRAKRQGLLLKSEGASTAGLIDDAVQAVELDPESTMEHQQSAADNHFKTTAETWKALGAELDVVKTIFSSCKFIYLNRFFCEGSEVLMPMKVFARADKEFSRRFATVFSQMDTVMGAYRAAVEKGCCPYSAYFCAITRCVQLAVYANSSMLNKDGATVINSAFAPRGMGGWGLPHLVAWLTQEGQDALSMYTFTMCSAIDACSDKVVKEKLNTLLMGTLDQDLAIVGIGQLLQNPGSVQVAGVSSAEAEVTRKLKNGMINKCKSKVFLAALQAGEGEVLLESLSRLVKSCRWDISILELLGQCLPSSCSAALVDRAYKNELVTQLFPYRVRSEMSAIVRRGSANSVIMLANKSFMKSDVMATRGMAYALAASCRERFFEKNAIEVCNHTIPDYGSCLAAQYKGDNPGLVVKCKGPRGSCVSNTETTRNLYDGIPTRMKSSTPRSTSVYTFTGERYRYMTPVQRCICKAAVVSAYLTSWGGHGKLFWDIVMTTWGAEYSVAPPVVTTQIKQGTSTKRLSAARSHLTHSIAAYRNVHGCVEVIADPIGAYLANKKVHIDYMSLVTAARTIGLLNMSLETSVEDGMELAYGFLEGSLPPTDEDKLTVFDPESVDKALNDMVKGSDKTLFVHVLESMLDVQYSKDEGEEYVCIGFQSEHLGVLREGNVVSIAAGYLSNIINCGVVSTSATRKRTTTSRIAGDEVLSRPVMKAETRMRILLRNVTRSQAVVCLAMETVRDLCPGGVKMNIAQAPWKQVPEQFRLTFPAWENYWSNTVQLMRRFTNSVDPAICRALLGPVQHHVVNHLANLDERTNDSSLLIVSYLYLSSYGRLRCSESYTLTSALGVEHMSRVWGLAHKVRVFRSRLWKTRETRERTLMASIYHGLSMASQNFYSKLQVLRSIPGSIRSHMSSYFTRFDYVGPEIDERFLAAAPDDNPYWNATLQRIIGPLREVRLDVDYLRTEINNLANDIFVLGDTQQLRPEMQIQEYQPLQPYEPEIQIPTMEIPGEGLDLPEEGRDEMEVEQDVEQDEILLQAVSAFLELGMNTAMDVYNGVTEWNIDPMITREDIDEFLAAMRLREEEDAGEQVADET